MNQYTTDPERNENQNTARISFLKDALYTHARQVNDFCQSGFRRIESYDPAQRSMHYSDFAERATRLLDQLSHLLRSARNAKSLSTTINLEQLEAKVIQLYAQFDSYENQLQRIA